jgi:hypothetical protein
MHGSARTARLKRKLRKSSGRNCVTGGENPGMRETYGEKARARERNLRWMEALWEGTSTSAKEEDQKEEVLAVFRDLVRESRSERAVREYVPWQPLW